MNQHVDVTSQTYRGLEKSDTTADWRICQEKLSNWMRSEYPRDTALNISVETGVPHWSVHNWLHKKGKPNLPNGLALFDRYGFTFLASCLVLPPDRILKAADQERRCNIEAEISRLTRELSAS